MSVQDLVLESIGDVQEADLSMQEIFEESDSVPLDFVISELQRAEELLASSENVDATRRRVSKAASYYIAASQSIEEGHAGYREEGMGLLFLLMDYLNDPNRHQKALLQKVRYLKHQMIFLEMLEDPVKAIDYLQGFWGADTAAKLAELTQTSSATVERWVAQKRKPQKHDTRCRIISIVEAFYLLETRALMSKSDILQWADKVKLRGGENLFDFVKNDYSFYCYSLRTYIMTALRRKGIDKSYSS